MRLGSAFLSGASSRAIGPRAALGGFVDAHLGEALDAARRAARGAGVRDEDLVHEAAHVGVTEAWSALEGREREWPARVAVRTIAHRRALDLLRRRRARGRRERALEGRDASDLRPGPGDLAETEERRARVREAIEALSPEEQRWVAALIETGGATAAALSLGMPRSSFRSRIERVCEALRRRLGPFATAGVLVLAAAAGLAPNVHRSVGSFAVRPERAGTSALLDELRAEAAHYRTAAASGTTGGAGASLTDLPALRRRLGASAARLGLAALCI